MQDERDVARRILVIDDTKSIHEDFRAVLAGNQADTTTLDEATAAIFGDAPAPSGVGARKCYELDCALQGQQGLEKVQQSLRENRPYQLAFVDMRMPPGWDGLKTIEEVWKVDPNIQVVICTAYSDHSWDTILASLGCVDKLLILKKPFDNVEVEQLASALTTKWLLARRAEARMSELEQAVSTRTREIEAANQQLTREIADRKAAEEKFRSFVENASDIIFCLSAKGIFTYVSPKWSAILGHDIAEVLGQPLHQFVSPEDQSTCRQMLETIVTTGQKQGGIELRIRRKDRAWRWHMVSASPVTHAEGEVTAIVGIAHDTTRRREADEEIRRAQQELQQILSAATPLCVIDTNFDIRMLNDTLCALFGLSAHEATGRKCYELMHTSKCHTLECPLQKMPGDPGVYQYEVSRENDTGEEICCVATATPYFSKDYSDVVGVVVSFMNITERKKGEKAIAEANLKLEKAYRELKEMQSQMVQNEKLASIGQLAAGVAHEMNTPVGFVASNFQTLRSYMNKFARLFTLYEELARFVESGQKEERLAKMCEIDDFRQRTKVDFIMSDMEDLFSDSKEGLERVTGIIQNLRDFSRIDQPQDVGEYDLNAGLKATLVVARNEVKYDANVQLELSDVPLVTCHSGQINQVFLNLLINAAHAIKDQEREDKGTICVRTYDTDAHVVCELSDDGPGIPPEIVSKVFDPFFTTKPPGKGTGLGLSVSHDIVVSKHKGELSVDSEVGRGTTFTVKLPKQQSIVEDEKGVPNEAQNRAVRG